MKFFGLFAVSLSIFLATTLYGAKTQTHAVVGDVSLDQSVGGTATLGNVAFQKLTDTANASYFLDPAATGDSLIAAGKVTAGSFAGNGSLLTGISGIPAGLVSFFNLASCPTGWTELTAARGMTIVGLPASGTLAGTVGTGFSNLENRTHTHTGPNHTHSQNLGASDPDITGSGGTGFASSCATWADGATIVSCAGQSWDGGGYVINSGVSAAGTGVTSATSATMPYIQLLACQKD